MRNRNRVANFTFRIATTLVGLCASTTLASAAATFTFSPASFTFPVTTTGSTSTAQTTTVTNTGTTTASITSIALGGNDPGDFVISAKTCTTSLAASATCTVSVAFKPVTSGIRAAALVFTDSATGSPQSVPLQGTAQSATQSLSFYPTSLAFPVTTVGVTSGSVGTTITNFGTATVSISGVHLQGGNAGEFAISGNSCATLTQGATCSVSVTFTPAVAGVRQTSLVFTDTAAGSPQTVPVVGTSQTATQTITVAPTSGSFGTVNLATTSSPIYFSVTNTGTAAVTYTSATITGTSAADYAITNQTNCVNGAFLNPNGTCYVYVTFTPSVTGVRAATLNITDNATGSPQTVTLYGVGQNTTNAISFSKGTLDLGVEPLTVASAQTYVQVQNTGTTPVTFTSVAIGGTNAADFTITSNGCSGVLNALSSCYEYVNFTPSVLGQRSATLNFTDSATGSPQTVSLVGTGVNQTQSLAFNYLNYGFGALAVGATSNAYYEAVYNAGVVPVTFSSIAIAGTNAADFSISNQGCPISPATFSVGATCYVYVTFSPSAAGVRSATLQYTDTATGSPQSIGLGGLGLAQLQTLSFTAPNLVFPGIAVGSSTGTQYVGVTNTGDQPVTFNSATLTGSGAAGFVISSNGCTSTLNPTQTCYIYVYSAPLTPGVQAASLSLSDSAIGSPQAIPLAGDGEPASPSLSPSVSNVNFGLGVVGVTSPTTSITMTNISGSSVSITFHVVGPNTADFVVTNNTCSGALGSGANCTLKVAFDAVALGARTAALEFTIAGVNQDVLVSGIGASASQLLTIQPAIDFGYTTVGSSSAQLPVSIQNTGAVPVNVTSNTVTGANATDFTIASTTCGAVIAPSITCAVNMVFSPTVAGERTATLQIADSATGSPQSVGLSGVAQTSLASLTVPSTIDLGSTITGSPVQAGVVVVNNGTLAVTVSKTTITGTNATDFSIAYNPCSNINAYSTCTIQVAFNPSGAGVRSATLKLTDTATGSPQSITLVGVGQTSVATISLASAVAFSTVPVASYNTQYLGVSNTGTVTVNITSVAIAGLNAADFTVYNACPAIGAGSSCSLLLAFVPSASGLRTATLTITDSATGSPHKVALTGVGQAANLALSIPQALAYPAVTVGSYLVQSFPIYNIGNTTILFNSVVVTGTNAADFVLLSSCPQMNAGVGCTIYIAFAPTGSATRTAAVQFTDNATGSPQSVTLTGIGQGKTASAGLTPSSVVFSNQTVGTQSGAQNIYLTNNGAAPVVVSKVAIGGTNANDFRVYNSNCPGATLNQNQNCYIQVTFTPTATGARSATVTVTDNATGGSQTSTLSGTGQ